MAGVLSALPSRRSGAWDVTWRVVTVMPPTGAVADDDSGDILCHLPAPVRVLSPRTLMPYEAGGAVTGFTEDFFLHDSIKVHFRTRNYVTVTSKRPHPPLCAPSHTQGAWPSLSCLPGSPGF